ncbi:hypothetical protein BJV82DRAFT_675119 [Fennellomyces sp. T-0311]|nr:hypothetical protein BJV82DRAFT_675119 [Fennellomyces sp. T-0311]
METNAPARFTLCNNEKCCSKFNFIDVATVHTVVDGPDPRDHFANERNMLTWLRISMVLALIGFMTLLDLPTKVFAPSQSIPWTEDSTSLQVQVVSYIFIGLGIASICVGVMIYFKNFNQIVNRYFTVGQGFSGFGMVLAIVLFVLFVMAAALT